MSKGTLNAAPIAVAEAGKRPKRPRNRERELPRVHVSMPKELFDRLGRTANRRGTSRSQVILDRLAGIPEVQSASSFVFTDLATMNGRLLSMQRQVGLVIGLLLDQADRRPHLVNELQLMDAISKQLARVIEQLDLPTRGDDG